MADLNKQMDELQQQANDYGAPKDRYDGFRNQMMRQKDMLAQQLLKYSEELIHLEQIDTNKTFEKVEFGAAFILNKQIIVVAAPIGKIDISGNNVFAISASVPIFIAAANKKAGEKFLFNGKEQIIEKIF